MTELSRFERAALTFILEAEVPEYLPQLSDLRVLGREETGMGVVLDFAEHPPVSAEAGTRRLGNDVYGLIEGSDDVLRFELIAEGGRLADLEMFSNAGETWPQDLSRVRLVREEAVAASRPLSAARRGHRRDR